MGGGFIVLVIIFFGLTLPLLVAGLPVENGKILALIGFWLVGIACTILPLGFRLEVGADYVKSYFLGILISNTHSSNVLAVAHGNLFLGRLGGEGLIYRTLINGRSKTYSIGEIIYGKEAIAHAGRVLGQNKVSAE